MIGSISPYAALTIVMLLIVAVGVLWLCRDAMRSGTTFEGEIGNRLLSMKLQTRPAARADPATDPAEGVRGGPERSEAGDV